MVGGTDASGEEAVFARGTGSFSALAAATAAEAGKKKKGPPLPALAVVVVESAMVVEAAAVVLSTRAAGDFVMLSLRLRAPGGIGASSKGKSK